MTLKQPYKLTAAAGTAIVIANMVGTGAFTSLGFQLKDLQSPLAILSLWILGGLLALAGAFSYAEVGTSIKKSGGEYAFLSEIYHPLVGYLSGWISLTVGFAAPIALSAIAFSRYFPVTGIDTKWIAIVMIAGITFLHTLTLRTSSRLQVITTLFKIAVMAALILPGLIMKGHAAVEFSPDAAYYRDLQSGAFAIALVYVSYSYSGWNAAAYISEEFRNPRKALPLALIGGTLIVTLLYTLLQFVFLKHTPVAALAGQLEVGAIATKNMFGATAAQCFGLAISLLLVSGISAMVWVGPRVTSGMAAQHRLWQYFRPDASGIPRRALWLQFAISLLLILTGTFEQIMVYCGVLLTLSTMMVVGAVFILRLKKQSETAGTYRSPLFPLFQVLYLLLCAWMICYTINNHPLETLTGLGSLLAGIITYGISKALEPAKHNKRAPEL
ncbi:APC family permease [Taibaiella chishuiensis]|uniref:Amino acid/polyamine/organocation transporter (APC superfamily) n=1 Tax=Taibaiella chishuiensis TaxID=1434707 RepID=A0A2P8D8F0_9BACT|nr:amino acid permease [Taibaiella chishuiensis]PSK93505.1 amino acid/polyamine/organocation transporter (APC superfamily) [Taibaiella chishuiensis]